MLIVPATTSSATQSSLLATATHGAAALVLLFAWATWAQRRAERLPNLQRTQPAMGILLLWAPASPAGQQAGMLLLLLLLLAPQGGQASAVNAQGGASSQHGEWATAPLPRPDDNAGMAAPATFRARHHPVWERCGSKCLAIIGIPTPLNAYAERQRLRNSIMQSMWRPHGERAAVGKAHLRTCCNTLSRVRRHGACVEHVHAKGACVEPSP